MLDRSLEEIRELCAKIAKESNTAKVVPMLARLLKLLAELKVSASKAIREGKENGKKSGNEESGNRNSVHHPPGPRF